MGEIASNNASGRYPHPPIPGGLFRLLFWLPTVRRKTSPPFRDISRRMMAFRCLLRVCPFAFAPGPLSASIANELSFGCLPGPVPLHERATPTGFQSLLTPLFSLSDKRRNITIGGRPTLCPISRPKSCSQPRPSRWVGSGRL